MAAPKISKKSLFEFLESYNINKVDLVIYASCLAVFIVSVVVFVFFSTDLKSKIDDFKEYSDDYDSSLVLKTQEKQITEGYGNLDTAAFELRNRFMSEKQVNDFKEAVKILAKKYNCDKIDATERSEPADAEKVFLVKTAGGERKNIKIKFKRRAIEFSFQMTLGNFLGFLKSFEKSNKMMEVQPFKLTQGDNKNSVRLNNFLVMVYLVPADLDKELVNLIGDVSFEENITEIQLGEKAQVVPILEKKLMVKETVKTKDGEWDIRPVFRGIEPPKPKAVVPPSELRYFMSTGSLTLFTYNNDMNTPYYASVGGVLKTRDGKTIPGYDELRLKEVTKMGFILEMDEVVGELSKLKR